MDGKRWEEMGRDGVEEDGRARYVRKERGEERRGTGEMGRGEGGQDDM